ncbi:MAG: DUF2298 domain-containing protein [Patescibacteria group bacterium]
MIVIYWWFILFLFNLPALALGQRLFKDLPDRGYALIKVLGLAIVSYSIWLLSSLHLLAFTQINILVVFLGLSFINVLLIKKEKFFSKIIIFEELLFFVGLAGWSYVRMYKPEIFGLEKFTDFALVNTAFRSNFMPPLDPWLAGHTVNYYYFGQFVTAMLAKFSNIGLGTVYNLMIATLFGLTFSGAFSIVYNLTKKIRAGILAGLLLTLGGNLHTIYAFSDWSKYWYPSAVRFIPFTITEFPAYSFVVADLHAHLLDIPFVLLIITFVLTFKPKMLNFLTLGVVLAMMLMTNSLDAPIYAGLLFLVLLPKYRLMSIIYTLIPVILMYILSLPFILNFTPFVSGIRLNNIAHSPIEMFLILWGFPLLIFGIYFVKTPKNWFVTAGILLVLGLIVFPEIAYFKDIYPTYFRANTMFKLGYQAFIIFSLLAPYIIFNCKKRLVFLPFLFLIFLYPLFSLPSNYGFKYNKPTTLDGLAYMQPEDLAIVNWLNKNVLGQPVIVEAVGESYSNYARFSTNTGLPTILGWPGHEWGWHLGPEILGTRREDVRQIYESADPALLSKYKVEYIIVASLERKDYKINEEKFSKNFKLIFQTGTSKIYKL